jgi:hypothetical protein
VAVDCDLAIARRKRMTARTPLFSNRRPEHYRALVAAVRGASLRDRGR